MAIKDQTVNLILRAKNFLTGDTDKAADSVDGLAKSAERLQDELRELEDNSQLVKQFTATEKAVDRTSAAYDRARLKADKLGDKITKVGVPTQRQAQEFEAAQKAVSAAEREYTRAEKTLGDLAEEAHSAGINLEDLNGEQRRLAESTKAAQRELEDLSETTEKSDSRFLSFRKNLSAGIVTFGKWATAATAAGAALAVGVLTRFTASQSALARQTLASADAFGISAVKLQEWQYASDRVGVSGEKTADIMKDVAEKIGDAFLTGGGEAADVIKGLNLDIEKLVRLKPDEQILAISERLTGLPKPAQIQILESLASDASLLLPLLDNNAEKLRELSAEAQKRGAIFSEDELKALTEVDSGFQKILASVKGFGNQLVVKLAPAFKGLAETIDAALLNKPKLVDDISSAFVTLIEKTQKFISAIVDDAPKAGSVISNIATTTAAAFSAIGSAFQTTITFVRDYSAELTLLAKGFIGLKIAQAISAVVSFGSVAVTAAANTAIFSGAINTARVSITRLQAALLGLGAFVVGWEIGTYLRDKFVGIEKAGIAMTAGLLKSWEYLKTGWEKVKAIFTDDTWEDADRRLEERLRGIDDIMGDLFIQAENNRKAIKGVTEEVENVADGVSEAAEESKEALKEVAVVAEETVSNIKKIYQSLSEANSLEELNEYREALTALWHAGAISAEDYIKGLEDAQNKQRELGDEGKGAGEEIAKGMNQARESVSELGQEVSRAEQAIGDTAARAEAIGERVSGFYNTITANLASLSEKAVGAFQKITAGQADLGALDELSVKLETVEGQIRSMQQAVHVDRSGIVDWMKDASIAAATVERDFYKQKIALEELVEQFERGESQSRLMGYSVEDLSRQFNLLDDQDLSRLAGAIDRVNAEVDGLNDSLQDTISSLRQELASLQGDNEQLEQLRYQEQRLELETQLQRARGLGDRAAIAAAQEALDLAQKAYNIRLAQAKQRTAEDKARVAEQAAEAERQRQLGEAQQREATAQNFASEDRQNTTTASSRTIIIQAPDGRQASVTTDNEDDLISVLESLGRRVS